MTKQEDILRLGPQSIEDARIVWREFSIAAQRCLRAENYNELLDAQRSLQEWMGMLGFCQMWRKVEIRRLELATACSMVASVDTDGHLELTRWEDFMPKQLATITQAKEREREDAGE